MIGQIILEIPQAKMPVQGSQQCFEIRTGPAGRPDRPGSGTGPGLSKNPSGS
jgi:hypothetical protein